jgi:YfiH family protein
MVFIATGVVEPAVTGGRPARWAATARSGGTSSRPYESLNLAGYVGDDPYSVQINRGIVAAGLELDPSAICLMDAVHGAELAVVDGPGVVVGVDALLTQTAGLAIVALAADCVPLALIGTDGITVAAAHCGWRGLVADVVAVAVMAMRDHGTEVARAVLGPAVCGRCYPVPDVRANEVRDHAPAAVQGSALIRCQDGQPGIDVRAGVRARLLDLGIGADRISLVGGCTVEDPGLFSFRRDGRTGRQGVAVCTLNPGQWWRESSG